jgi:hypothetical protein
MLLIWKYIHKRIKICLYLYIRLKIKPNSVRIRFLICQICVLPSTGFELTPLIYCSTNRLALCPAPRHICIQDTRYFIFQSRTSGGHDTTFIISTYTINIFVLGVSHLPVAIVFRMEFGTVVMFYFPPPFFII